MFRRLTDLIKYKAELAGIKVEVVSEMSGCKHEPSNRNFKYPSCVFEYHRDVVGAINKVFQLRSKWI